MGKNGRKWETSIFTQPSFDQELGELGRNGKKWEKWPFKIKSQLLYH
jgi:hypothetical protein